VADWSGGMSASCKPRVQLFADAGNGWPLSALRYHQFVPISCHFRICKVLLVTSLTHVRGAIASTRPLPLLTQTQIRRSTQTVYEVFSGHSFLLLTEQKICIHEEVSEKAEVDEWSESDEIQVSRDVHDTVANN